MILLLHMMLLNVVGSPKFAHRKCLHKGWSEWGGGSSDQGANNSW